MSQCPRCGAPTEVDQSFCGNCGASLVHVESEAERTAIRPVVPPAEPPGLAPEDPTVQFPVQPPAETPAAGWIPGFDQSAQAGQVAHARHTPEYAAPSTSPLADLQLDWLLKGNWIGAAKTAGAAFGVALVLGLVVAFAGAEELDAGSAFWMGLMLTANAFGANTILDVRDLADADPANLSVGQYPLLATFLALGFAALVFRRATVGYASVKDVLLDAVRSAFILTLFVTFVAIVARIATPEIKGYDAPSDSGGGDVFGILLLDGDSRISVTGAIFLPFLLLLVVLAAVSVTRADLWVGRLSVVHEWLAAPLAGVAALMVALFGAGLVWMIAELAGDSDARGFSEMVRLLAVLPAVGMHLLGLGVLSKIGGTSDGDRGDTDDWERLWDFADQNGALFWIAPVAAVAIAVFCIRTVVRNSTDRSTVLRHVGVFLAGLLIVVPLLVRLANGHIGIDAEFNDGGSVDQDSVFGLEGFQTLLLVLLLSAVVAAVLLVVTGNLDLNQVKTKASAFAKSVQTNPGQPMPPGPPPAGPPPGWQPPTGPPPGWQPPPGPPPSGPPPSGPPPGWQPPPQQ